MTTDALRLPAWLKRQFQDTRQDGRCIRIQLLHLASGRQRGVRTWPFPDAGEQADDDIQALISDILKAAQEDAADLFGRQRYGLYAYYETRPDIVAESCTIVMYGGGEGASEEESIENEGPNQKGLLAMLMRHANASHQLVMQSALGIQRALSETNQLLAGRLTHMEERHYGVLQSFEDLTTQKHGRDLADKESKVKLRALEEGLDALKMLFPTIVNAVAGRRLLPEKQSTVDGMIGAFMESIDKEQMDALMGVLKPEQTIVLMTLFNQYQEAKAREAAERGEEDRKREAAANGGAPAGAASGA